jgi:hypothetical protein
MPFIGQQPAPVALTSSDITDGIISNAKLAQDIISADTALGAEPADTDELLVSDAGTLKRMDYSHIKAGGGDFVKITTSSASAASSLSIDGHFTSDYDRYILHCQGVCFTDTAPAASDRFTFRLNQSATAVTSGYQYAKLFCYNSGVSAQTDSTYFFGMYLNENETSNRGNLIIDILDPLQTSYYHSVMWRGQGIDAGTRYETSLGAGCIASTTAVTGVTLKSTDSFPFNIDKVILYGMKD